MDQQPAYVKFKPGADLTSLVISRENDSAHFVSRCIARLGGGLPISNRDGMALGILSVPVLVSISGVAEAELITEQASISEASQHIRHLAPGDVIVYHSEDGTLGHSALPIGGGLISCHSICRWEKHFTDPSGKYDTFLHI